MNITIPTDLQQLISTDQAWHYSIVPKEIKNGTLFFYADKENWTSEKMDELEMLLGEKVEVVLLDSELLKQTLGKYYRKSRNPLNSSKAAQINSEDFIYQLISEANSIGSSDIHIESYVERCRIRLRIDGRLIERYVISVSEYPALVNKLKIKANLDIAEKRLPQDGRISFNGGKDKIDIRISILPTLHGEKVVMRLLSKDATEIDIKKLGFSDRQLNDFLEGSKRSHGIVLLSGPTGSGKTTTLYATLKILNDEKTNIVTIEDPIEYTLEGINQVQLRENIGLTFSGALRSFLRQDPDVIMLGEIRDAETAQMAIRAALTGHLVLSTIHTNSAWGTISRLVDMGVPSYLLASTMNITAAQRLVRLLCEDCKETVDFDESLFPNSFDAPRKLKSHCVPRGCGNCHYTGYIGRKAVYEIIPIDQELAGFIKENRFNIKEDIEKRNIEQLMDNAFHLLEKGKTSVEEVYSMLMNSY